MPLQKIFFNSHFTSYKITVYDIIIQMVESDRFIMKINGWLIRAGYKLAGRLRMDTQGSLEWIVEIYAVLVGFGFISIPCRFTHSDSDTGGNI